MKYFLTIILSVAGLIQLNAQDAEAIATALETTPAMEINPDLLPLDKSTQNGFTSYLNSSVDMAEKKWKAFLETKYMSEVKKSKGYITALNTIMSDISKAPLTVTASFSEDENGCKMNAFYNMNGSYINPKEHPKETAAIMTSLKDYQKQLYVEVFRVTLEEQRKAQEKEQKALDKLVKEGDGLAKDVTNEEADINKSEQAIIDAEKKISELQAKMQEMKGEIEQSRATIGELKEASAKKQTEIQEQTSKIADHAKRIERIKASSDKLGN
ncbi:MAG: hypothetical protein AB8B53_00925 [Flavobacteriales bacterium]